MIDGLVGGTLMGTAQARTGQSGKPFFTAKLRVPVSDGGALFASVISFSTTVGDALLALTDGDAVVLTGSLTPKVWTDRHGEARATLDVMASSVMTAYEVRRKRKATQPRDEPETACDDAL